jgi:hypothetical protein
MTPKEEARIKNWHDTLAENVVLDLNLSDDPQSETLRTYCEIFTHHAPRIGFKKKAVEPDALPGIRITPQLAYHAAPQGPELDPFLDAITQCHHKASPGQTSGHRINLTSNLPAMLKLFVAPQCPFCPAAVRQLLPLVQAGDNLGLAIIDSLLFEDYAQELNIQSVPTLLLDDHYRWSGTLPLQEIIQIINHRNPIQLGTDSLHNMLQQGDAEKLAAMMVAHATIFPGLYALLTHSKWPVRLGAMVVMETLCDQAPDLAKQVIAPLQDKFSTVDETVQGDILYTIGQAGDLGIIPWLESIEYQSASAEIKEAVREAVQSIRTRIVNSEAD